MQESCEILLFVITMRYMVSLGECSLKRIINYSIRENVYQFRLTKNSLFTSLLNKRMAIRPLADINPL